MGRYDDASAGWESEGDWDLSPKFMDTTLDVALDAVKIGIFLKNHPVTRELWQAVVHNFFGGFTEQFIFLTSPSHEYGAHCDSTVNILGQVLKASIYLEKSRKNAEAIMYCCQELSNLANKNELNSCLPFYMEIVREKLNRHPGLSASDIDQLGEQYAWRIEEIEYRALRYRLELAAALQQTHPAPPNANPQWQWSKYNGGMVAEPSWQKWLTDHVTKGHTLHYKLTFVKNCKEWIKPYLEGGLWRGIFGTTLTDQQLQRLNADINLQKNSPQNFLPKPYMGGGYDL